MEFNRFEKEEKHIIYDISKFSDIPEGGFNRFTVTYKSDSCVKAQLTYLRKDLSRKTETFFLEPSDGSVPFSCYTDGYLAGECELGFIGIELIQAELKPLNIEISAIAAENAPVLTDTVVYAENEYMKIGAKLAFGGGLTYLEDKQHNVPGVTNVLNFHDTGRLVQQSYYGFGESPYVQATFMGNKWVYNPVQGGDQHYKKSKLVDYSIKPDSLYVKCIPMDWAQNGLPTMTYMENTYAICGNMLKVNNRFIDFSGYPHLCRHQELPAFYTISYLKKFAFYDGSEPWTGGALREERDLGFWAYDMRCHFKLKPEDTEIWSAWTDDDPATGDFGVGLFTPGATNFSAGRYNYNGTKNSLEDPTNYTAPLRAVQLKSFKAFTYDYLITTGTLSEIRSRFTEHKDDIDNKSMIEY